ncbi:DUF411 domain-containing protein [Parendozoicomonas sp. Alg238-R29]|uniref:DUF411 domain-containing protein n=1 Tax=Parendozoicomonas sp. Alg238-R29 TaxID=2993446 RepID=UPI00248F286D|nr:DUF411 domain-containing protein [Parendozoicomonas sp. Alg238-R29]
MSFIKSFIAGSVLAALASTGYSSNDLPDITVYKSATCGCCSKWVEHLEDNGFNVVSQNVTNLSDYKQKANLPNGLGSCHTAFVGGYAIEGHVPAADIKAMLQNRPEITGLAVPGMPMGSPGMEYNNQKDAYQVLGYTKEGEVTVFSSH